MGNAIRAVGGTSRGALRGSLGRLVGFAGVGFNTVEQVKRAVTIKIVLKSAQPNKPGWRRTTIYRKLALSLSSEPARAAILKPLLRAGHISQCADHNITVCHVGAVCFGFRAAS